MANKLAIVTGNFTTAGTWVTGNTGTNALLISSSTSVTALTTSNLDSATFTPAAQASQYLAIRVGSRASGSPSNKMTVKLRNSTTATDIWTFVINVSDIPVCDTTADQGGWLIFKAAAGLTPNGTDTYVVRCVLDSTSTAVSLCTNGTANNWQRQMFQTATGAPAAGDDMLTGGIWDTTNPAVKTDVAVTMNETATTDYGSANTAYRIAALNICKGSSLTFATGIAAILRLSGHLVVYSGGTLTQGSSGTPIPRANSAELQMDCAADLNWGIIIKSGGTRNFYGQSRLSGVNNVYTTLNADAAAAATSLTTSTQLSAATTDDIAIGATNNTNRTQSETRVMNGDAGATSIAVTVGLTNAHNGDNNEQALIISLTRNVRVVGTNSSFMTFEQWDAGSTCNAQWASWRYCGQGNTVPGLLINNTNATVDKCAFRESDGNNLFVGPTSVGASITDCVGYNAAGSAANSSAYRVQSGSTTVTINGLYVIVNTNTAAFGIGLIDMGASLTQCDNLWAVGYVAGIACGNSAGVTIVQGSGRTFSTWTANSNSTGFDFGSNAEVSNGPQTFATLKAWRNVTNGLALVQARELTFTDLWTYNNGAHNITFAQGGTAVTSIRFLDHRNGGGGTDGIGIGAASFLTDIVFEGGKWGTTAGGSFTANSGNTDVGFNGATSNNYYEIFFNNCTFDQSTAASWHSATVTNYGSIFRFMKRNGNANEHLLDKKGYGVVAYETTTVDATPSIKMTPTSGANYKLDTSGVVKGWGFFVPVDNGSTPAVSVKIQKDGSYTGNAPRLILKRNDQIGVTADAVIGTFSGGSGSFQTVSGTTAAATAAGVMEFVVDCDGSAGNIFVDTFTVAGTGASALSGLSYWYGGLAC